MRAAAVITCLAVGYGRAHSFGSSVLRQTGSRQVMGTCREPVVGIRA